MDEVIASFGGRKIRFNEYLAEESNTTYFFNKRKARSTIIKKSKVQEKKRSFYNTLQEEREVNF